MSQIASNVKYIQLETNKDCLIRPVVRYFFTDSLIFVSNRDHILKFSRDGKFLKKIGNPGRGPGEIDFIREMSIVPDKRLVVIQLSSKRELLYFNFDGELVKTVSFTAPYFYVKVFNDEKYLIYEHGIVGNEAYSFILVNKKWDTISTVENYTKWIHNYPGYSVISYPDFNPFYLANGQFQLKAMYNDTVYKIESDKIKPSYFLNLGKFKLPEELRPERLGGGQLQKFVDHSNEYFFAMVHEAVNNVFFRARTYGGSFNKYVLFDKRNQKGILLVDEHGDSKGFVNDWDGGMDFWPTGSVNDNQLYMPINALNFQKEFINNKSSQRSIKFPKKQRQLEEMITGLDILNNPIIMVVTLKPDK